MSQRKYQKKLNRLRSIASRELSSNFVTILLNDMTKQADESRILKEPSIEAATSAVTVQETESPENQEDVQIIEEKIVDPIEILQPEPVDSLNQNESENEPFVVNPLSKGYDYHLLRAAVYFKKASQSERKKHPKKYLMFKDHLIQNIYPSPTNHQEEIQAEQVPVVSSSSQNKSEKAERDSKKIKFLLLIFFQKVCPAALMQAEGCVEQACENHHTLPDHNHLERQLFKNSRKDSVEVYEFVMQLPLQQRIRFLPAFANVFTKFNQTEMLKRLIRDHQKSDPAVDFAKVIDAMVRNGSSNYDAINFVIENHIETPAAREQIVKIIGSTGSDVIKFTDYLNKH